MAIRPFALSRLPQQHTLDALPFSSTFPASITEDCYLRSATTYLRRCTGFLSRRNWQLQLASRLRADGHGHNQQQQGHESRHQFQQGDCHRLSLLQSPMTCNWRARSAEETGSASLSCLGAGT